MAIHLCESCGENCSGKPHKYVVAVLVFPGGFRKEVKSRICKKCLKTHKDIEGYL